MMKQKTLGLRIAFVIAGTAFAFLTFPCASNGESAHSWIRFLVVDSDQLRNMPGVPFVIAYTDYSDETYALGAGGWYRYTQGRDPVVLHGKREPGGLFRPALAYEVAMEDKTKWKRIPAEVQPDSDTITVSPENPIIRLTMSMEPFRSCIGIYRYGRVVLESGDSAILALEDLLPTANARGATGDFREDVSGGDLKMRESKQGFKQPRPSDPAHLCFVTSLGDRLIGDFIFVAPSENAVTLQGTKTLDGDFWPKVVYQVSNSGEQWETIGKSKHSGTPATIQIPGGKADRLRILLTDYKPLIGKYKYGRIVFSNGESAVFYLELIDPKGS